MAIVKMKKLTLAAAACDADELMQKLMWTGSVEISDAASAVEGDKRLSPDERFSQKLSSLYTKLSEYEKAISFLKEYERAPKGLFPKRRSYKRELYDSPAETFSAADSVALKAQNIAANIDDIFAEEARIRASLAFLAPWKDFDLALSVRGTLTTEIIAGSLPKDISLTALREEMAIECENALLETVSENESSSHICVIALKEDIDKVTSLLAKKGFIRADFAAYKLSAADEHSRLLQRSEVIEIERSNLKTKAMKLAQELDVLRLACDIVSSDIAKTEAEKKLICTRSAVILSGWVPEKKIGGIDKILEGYECWREYSDPEEGDDVPVLLSNNSLATPFESIIDMYVLPAYGSFDPTAIMAVFYFIIFGFMLADVVYGLLLVIGGFWALKKLDLGKGIKQLVKLFAICGISCTIAGVFLGSYLGDLPSAIVTAFGGEAFEMPLTLINPLEEPILFIVVSLVVGFVHMLAGLAIKFYMVCRESNFINAFFDVGGWFIVFAGAGLIFVNKITGIIILAIGIAVMMTGGALKKKGIFGRIIGGFGAVYGFVGFASDLISYSRIMALGLTSAIIASVFNILATIALPSPLGFVLFIVVILFGHVLNLGINIIGTFVHASRLQYIEFFGKFYEDGGRKFAPLTTREKYTSITDPEKRD